MLIRVHRVTTERWSETDDEGHTRNFSHTSHTIEREERPRRSTQRSTKLARAKARYAPQSLRAPAGDTLVWVLDSQGTVRLLSSLTGVERRESVVRESGLKVGLKHAKPRVKQYDPVSLKIMIGGVEYKGFDWPSAGNPGRP